MIGLVVATHGELAQGFLDAAALIVGPQERAAALNVRRGEGVDALRSQLEALLGDVGRDADGVLILTDMFGGTPTNVGLTLLEPGRIEILAGVNLPMVLKFFNSRKDKPLTELVSILRDYGRQGVVLASEIVASQE